MTDEVNLDNLDALADLPDSADTAVEADPVADAAVDSINDNAEEQPVAADGAVESGTAENDAEASGDATSRNPKNSTRAQRPLRSSQSRCAPWKASGMCSTPIPVTRSA